MTNSAIIKFDHVLNVRDFGGQQDLISIGANAKINAVNTIKAGKLYRGAQMCDMSSQDQDRMKNFGVDLVIDCRFAPERQRQPSAFGNGFSPEVMEVWAQHESPSDQMAPHESFAKDELFSAADARRYMMGSYTDRPHNPAFVSLYGRALKRMASTGETVYVHCAAGKDRTGTFVALLLKLLGVSDADILHDYLLTRQAVKFNEIKHSMASKLGQRFGREYDPDALEPYFGVYPEYLEASFDQIGDVFDYTRQTLGLSDQEIDGLNQHYRGA